jgi:hypothetical protein
MIDSNRCSSMQPGPRATGPEMNRNTGKPESPLRAAPQRLAQSAPHKSADAVKHENKNDFYQLIEKSRCKQPL